ncbi:putative MFS family arabinose efflux permease [Asanoa ferruginea]|uniref:Putative MFS family arabinose efflux permease n=1 Tax=Asanoa ferruginea TaxID=53367 RepID=A0A3D9ZZT0_9ACTN|nr:MFS transporter [Asanoa ferruginea]REG02153.1 putative MFS family arabinose efflux permease [Asanoa ferruginea]GIF48550.1 MFS transporter [Asanoa ferruginea]
MLLVPPFRAFYLGRLVSLAGSAMTPVALAFAILDASGRPGDLGVVLACQIVPHLALLLVGGAVADRLPRRLVLVVANLGAGLTQGAIAVVLIAGAYRLPLVAGLALAAGALEAFTSPALRGIVPELVAGDDLQRANSLLSATSSAVKIIGPTVAGVLVVAVGGGWAIAVDAVSFVLAAVFLIRLPRVSPAPAVRAGLLREIHDGGRAFLAIPWVWPVALAYAVINLVNVGPWQILGPSLTRDRSGEAVWGLVLSVRAVGLLMMSVLMYRLSLRRPLRFGRLVGALGACSLIALGLGFDPFWLAACAFLGGVGFAASGITWDSALQRHVGATHLGRVSSIDELLSFAAIPIGQLLVGPAAAAWGGERVALACGIAFAVAALVPLTARAVRSLPGAPRPAAEPAPVAAP